MKNGYKTEKILLHGALITATLAAAVILMVSMVHLELIGIVSQILKLFVIAMPIMLLFNKGTKVCFILFTAISCIGLLLPSFITLINNQSQGIFAVSGTLLPLIAYIVIGFCSARLISSATAATAAAVAAGILTLSPASGIIGSLNIGQMLYSIGNMLFLAATTLLFIIIKLRSQRWFCPCGFRNSGEVRFCGGCGKIKT